MQRCIKYCPVLNNFIGVLLSRLQYILNSLRTDWNVQHCSFFFRLVRKVAKINH